MSLVPAEHGDVKLDSQECGFYTFVFQLVFSALTPRKTRFCFRRRRLAHLLIFHGPVTGIQISSAVTGFQTSTW